MTRVVSKHVLRGTAVLRADQHRSRLVHAGLSSDCARVKVRRHRGWVRKWKVVEL